MNSLFGSASPEYTTPTPEAPEKAAVVKESEDTTSDVLAKRKSRQALRRQYLTDTTPTSTTSGSGVSLPTA